MPANAFAFALGSMLLYAMKRLRSAGVQTLVLLRIALVCGPSSLLIRDRFPEASDATHGEVQRLAAIGVIDLDAAVLGLELVGDLVKGGRRPRRVSRRHGRW
jgi:hypothetical protein